ncbi:MAG: hypothetical protein MI810_14900 [Flavobacteriales bacterium]|nr:hypothetical protein [Flavobacteriales bacterium]
MTYNLLAYIIFLTLIFFIVFSLGWIFYQNGEVYLKMLLADDHQLVKAINKILLLGYYLLNLGYTAVSLIFWDRISSLPEMIEKITLYSAYIILGLALMHYFNMTWLFLYAKYRKRKIQFNES